jgi:hypothetical protein
MSDNLELKDKAFKYVNERRWDYLLVLAFLELEDYPRISKTHVDNFNEYVNIGLKEISSERKLLDCGYLKKETIFVKATYKDISFSIGGFRDPYDDTSGKFASSLIIDGKTALTMYYHLEIDPFVGHVPQNYSLIDVKELHTNPKIDELLLGIEALINEHTEKWKKKREQQENQQYEGKFSFDE